MDRRSDPFVAALVQARGSIEAPEKWTKKPNVYDLGAPICIGQALQRAWGDCIPNDLLALLTKAVGVSNAPDILAWNDAPERTHAEVLAALDRAIALRVEEISA